MWNLAKQDGWERYKKLTEDCKLEDIVKDEDEDVIEAVSRFERRHEKI